MKEAIDIGAWLDRTGERLAEIRDGLKAVGRELRGCSEAAQKLPKAGGPGVGMAQGEKSGVDVTP